MPNPTVSIITATFNRSNVLRLTIEAVRVSSFADWEMIVVGDACTDDTEEVVRSFQDPRITFFNLPQNSGDQATPDNAGLSRARGEYVAYLNHDDLWTKDHLERGLEAMAGSDLVAASRSASIIMGMPISWECPAMARMNPGSSFRSLRG